MAKRAPNKGKSCVRRKIVNGRKVCAKFGPKKKR